MDQSNFSTRKTHATLIKFEQMPSFPYWQIRDDPGSANSSSGSSQMERREEILFNFISEAQCVSGGF